MRYLLVLTLLLSKLVSAQTGGLKIHLVDFKTNKALQYCRVIVEQNKRQLAGREADTNGYAKIDTLDIGKYEIVAYYPGYDDIKIKRVFIRLNKITEVEIKMKFNPADTIPKPVY